MSIAPSLGKVSRKKVALFWDFVQITPSAQFGQLLQLFLNTKNIDLSDIQNDSLSKILLKLRQNTSSVGRVQYLKTVYSLNYQHFGGNRLLLLTKNALRKR